MQRKKSQSQISRSEVNLLSPENAQRRLDLSTPPSTPTATVSSDKRPKSSMKSLPMGTLLDIFAFLDVRHVLVLRRVCKKLADATQQHAVWVIMVDEHVLKNRLPWPPWALPLKDVPACTMEKLCIRAVRLLRCWERSDPKTEGSPTRCLRQAENSVTWLTICCSRWLVVQVSGRRLEFWDLENCFDSPRAVFDGLRGVIDGGKLLPGSGDAWSLVVSTRSYEAHALEVHLPKLGVDGVPRAMLARTWEGYSELLDAAGTIWAFGKGRTEQAAMILHSVSGRSVRLVTASPDELLNLPRAIQVLPRAVAVARTTHVDIYSMTAVWSVLGASSSTPSPTTVHPFQTLAYPDRWTGTNFYFVPTRPSWARREEHNPEDIYLIFTEPFLGSWVALVAHRQSNLDEEEDMYRLEEPYYFFVPQLYHAIVAVSWGQSARRLVHVVNIGKEMLLMGACMPPDPSLFKDYDYFVDRITTKWSLPGGGADYPKLLGFDEVTGVSAVSMASGRIWVVDPLAKAKEINMSREKLASPHPDPTWPHLHATPWPPEPVYFSAPESNGAPVRDWSASIEKYFPGKNRPDCFGGTKWFVNDVLHIQGPAETLLFTLSPTESAFPALEVVQAGRRLLIVQRDEDTLQYEAKALAENASLEDLLLHLHAGGTIGAIPGVSLSVDACSARQYSAWRTRAEPTASCYL